MSELSEAAQLLTGEQAPAAVEEPNQQEPSPEHEDVPSTGDSDTPKSEAETESPAEGQDQEFDPELYSLKVPGTDLTIGELKDRAKELAQVDERQAEAEAERQKAQSEALQARETLQTLVKSLGIEFTQEQVAEAQRLMGQTAEQNEAAAAANISGWDDPATREAEKARSANLLAEYGFEPFEIESARDWRFQRMVRDMSALRERVEKAYKDAKKPRSMKQGSTQRKTPASDANRAVADFKSGKTTQQTAVAALIVDGIRK